MALLMQLIINSIIAGAIYGLVAGGFSLIYNNCKFVHFAHGVVIAFSAYLTYFFFNSLGINFWFSILLTLLLASLLGWFLDFAIYKQLRKRKASSSVLLIASLGLLVVLESLILLLFGADVKTIGYIKVQKGIEFFGAIITPLQIVIVLSASLIFIGLYFFMKKTRIGVAMRAVSNNKDVAEIVGISSEKIYSWTFVAGSFIAGIAGILIGLEQNLEPTMGTMLIIKGFTASIIGGIGNVYASVVGSFLLGFAENFGVWFLPSGYKDAIAFAILFVFLLFRPKGLFGIKKEGEKE
jgi:branched-subunit amino acid ABC-type transport system permease component